MDTQKLHKYTLKPLAKQRIALPVGAEVLSVGAQGLSIVMWVRENPDNNIEYRNFCMVPTGGTVQAEDKFIGTVQLENGYVIHVIENP